MNTRPVETALELSADALASGEGLRLRVNGLSMRPLLQPEDVIWVEAVAEQDLDIGDIVLVRRPADFVTHRLVERTSQGWIAKGDNLPMPDPPVAGTDILGRVTALERGGRRRNWQQPEVRLARLAGLQYALWKRLQGRPAWAARWSNRLFRLGRSLLVVLDNR